MSLRPGLITTLLNPERNSYNIKMIGFDYPKDVVEKCESGEVTTPVAGPQEPTQPLLGNELRYWNSVLMDTKEFKKLMTTGGDTRT